MSHNHSYPEADRAAVYRVIADRRDMRHFAGGEIPRDVFARLLRAAHDAPSVGLMQPWRFIRITDSSIRRDIAGLVEAERQRTADAMGERASEFGRLKVAGIDDCAEVLVVGLPDGRERHIFGRRTMPHMDLASAACAIENMWLAARAEGYGMGWVSIFDPDALATLLRFPDDATPVAILCLGPVTEFYERPMLVETGWTTERPLREFVSENSY